ncbi:hypothetical protein R50072_09120 [Simiduia litorea]|uniref:hypothetical protein n=1 Tax=Simiduia litorea TaxID=1435348 RepID=UPI0036F20B18
MRVVNGFVVVLLLHLAVTGCASWQPEYGAGDPELLALARSGSLVGGQVSAQALADRDPFALTPEMKAFANHFAPAEYHDKYKVTALVRALTTQYGLNMTYSANETHSAAEAFRRREANCLSFTILLYALANEAGLTVAFNEVDVPPVWDVQDTNKLIFYKHVNAIVDILWAESKIVDINMSNYNELYPQRRITKVHAEALYYNNRAVEALNAGQLADAQYYFQRTLDLNSDLGFVWGNLATLYRRLERFDIAQALYLKAMDSGGFDSVIASNLARNFRALGNTVEADLLEERVKRHRARNPYYHYAIAHLNYSKGRNDLAIQEIDRAIELFTKEHRFHLLRAQLMAQVGDQREVIESLRLAESHAPNDEDKGRYANKRDKVAAIMAYQAAHSTE